LPRRKKTQAPVNEKEIGKRIRALREQRGMTQVELAQKLETTQTLVSQYEHGKLRLHGTLVAAIATALRASADEILGLTKAPEGGILKDKRFLRRLERIDQMSRNEKQAVLKTLDMLLRSA